MTRHINKIIIIAISALLLAMGISLSFVYFAPPMRQATRARRIAISRLFGANGSLREIKTYVAAPYLKHGSIANLNHYLSKDPGRREFVRNSDQNYADNYLEAISPEIERYKEVYANDGMEWTPLFMASTRVLFEQMRQDVLNITSLPDMQLHGQNSSPGATSAVQKLEKAVQDFGALWIPPSETQQTYRPSPPVIRDYLIGSRRFNNSMRKLDSAWRTLIATLYNLTTVPNWQLAVQFDPSLEKELDALIIAALSGDIHRRGQNLVPVIPDTMPSPGIRWNPEFSIYKNIPELTGQTEDPTTTFFFVKMNILYIFQDVRTQTWLNQHKDWLSNYFLSYFSTMKSREFISFKTRNESMAEWALATLKAKMIHPINRSILHERRFSSKMIGIRDLAFLRIHLIEDS